MSEEPEPNCLLVLTFQLPVNRWTAPLTIDRTALIRLPGCRFADAEEAYGWMLDEAIATGMDVAPDDWSGTEREDMIVLHWSVTAMHPR